MLGGAAVSVGLPLFDCFLNGNGTALAQGSPLPVRFGTWFWGCGMNPDRWVPTTEGADYELSPELEAIAPVREHISVLSGFNTVLDGRPNLPHWTGVMATLTGSVPERRARGAGADARRADLGTDRHRRRGSARSR